MSQANMMYVPHKKQKLLHDLGAEARERCFLAGNRTGKTYAGCMETSFHLTGEYPSWWKGKRFDAPISAWAASDTTQSTRDILQVTYMGGLAEDEYGTGTIPKEAIVSYTKARSIADALDIVRVKHKSGGYSEIGFKSYDQGRNKFQGTAKHWIHLDEEPPMDIYEECLTRTMTTKGQILATLTPLSGLTKMVQRFYNGGMSNGKVYNGRALVQASWADADHISEEDKESFRQSLSPEVLEARERGIPSVGTGMCYPVKESSILVERFQIPDSFKQAYSIDFGWSPDPTVALFGAYDPDTDIMYITKEYSQKERTPSSHADSLTRLGADWIRGIADPFGGSQSSQVDGESLIFKYSDAGLDIQAARRDKKLNGIVDVLQRMQEGRLKVFDDLEGWLSEFRMYAYDDKGRPKDGNDHFMDAMRYLVQSFFDVARSKHDVIRNQWNTLNGSSSRPNWRTV